MNEMAYLEELCAAVPPPGEQALAAGGSSGAPKPSGDHSHRTRKAVPVSIGPRPGAQDGRQAAPDRACDENPLAGFTLRR